MTFSSDTSPPQKTYIGTELDSNDHRLLIALQSHLQVKENRRIPAAELFRMALRFIAKAEGIN